MARRVTQAEATQLRRMFPLLNTSAVWVYGGATNVYNCLAWALGITNRWVWPWRYANPSDAMMTSYLRSQGYSPGSPVAAATYGTSASIGHIGRFWVGAPSSKLGSYLLISHGWLELNQGTYGNRYRNYARTAMAKDDFGAMEVAEVGVEATDLPALPSALQERLDGLTAETSAAARDRFETAYEAWRRHLAKPWVVIGSSPLAWTMGEEFVDVVSAAADAPALLIERLVDPAHHESIVIAERVLPPDAIVVFEYDDPAVLDGEQLRARLIAEAWLQA